MDFLFTVCQVGAENALKQEMGQHWPQLRFAYSRPGFVTFKMIEQLDPATTDLRSTFARTWGWSLGKVSGDSANQLADQIWELAHGRQFSHLHVWERDRRIPGEAGFEPGPTPLATEVASQILAAHAAADRPLPVNRVAHAREHILDCVLVEPNEWWIGHHQAATAATRWPGGVCPEPAPEHAISRAYRKMQEAILWSELPIAEGELVAEIGCAPGGAAQMLLDCGVRVLGIDPADVDEVVSSRDNFTHVKKRAADMKRRDFAAVEWLMSDANVTPKAALDAIETIVTHGHVHVRGLLLTLKLRDWKWATEIPDHLNRIREWGFRDVRARQLSVNRREFCVAASRSRAQRRFRTV